MTCLFCGLATENSNSIEHIVPESLGNKTHILPKGLVCDNCNNYFAVKLEKVVLEMPYFKNLRHREQIESKKGRIPDGKGIIISPNKPEVDIIFPKRGYPIISFDNILDAYDVFNKKSSLLIIPYAPDPEPNDKIISRFLAKIAVEGLLYSLIKHEGWIEEIVNHPDLVEIKEYARFGKGPSLWKYHQRRIYDERKMQTDTYIRPDPFQTLHEFKILVTKEQHYYFVLAIMGIEYTIGYGGPEINSYLDWLIENNNASILYPT